MKSSNQVILQNFKMDDLILEFEILTNAVSSSEDSKFWQNVTYASYFQFNAECFYRVIYLSWKMHFISKQLQGVEFCKKYSIHILFSKHVLDSKYFSL